MLLPLQSGDVCGNKNYRSTNRQDDSILQETNLSTVLLELIPTAIVAKGCRENHLCLGRGRSWNKTPFLYQSFRALFIALICTVSGVLFSALWKKPLCTAHRLKEPPIQENSVTSVEVMPSFRGGRYF